MMLTARLKCVNQKWRLLLLEPHSRAVRSCYHNNAHRSKCSFATVGRRKLCRGHFLGSNFIGPSLPRNSVVGGTNSLASWNRASFRLYSSEGDGRNASEEKHIPGEEEKNNINKINGRSTEPREDLRPCNEHARLGEQDQKDWFSNEKIAMECKKKESPFLTRREKFRNEFLRRIVPWEKISVSWDNFPYYINDNTRNILMECVISHLKQQKFAETYGSRLSSSSGRILLQSSPGMELYRERLVKALARDLKVPVLVLESSVLAPFDFGEDYTSENESDDENAVANDESSSESEAEEEWASSAEAKSDATEDEVVDVTTAEEALRKLVPCNLEEFEKRVSGECESSSESTKGDDSHTSDKSERPLRKGDRVKYIGSSTRVEEDNRELGSGQRGEVYEVDGERAAVIIDTNGHGVEKGEKMEQDAHPLVCWINVKDIEHDVDIQAEDWYIAVEALKEVMLSKQPLIVYLPDSSQWLARAVPKSNHKEFISKVQEMLDQLSGPTVLICGQSKAESGTKEKEKFTMILPNIGRLAKLPLPLRQLTEGLKASKRSEDSDIYRLFTNVMWIHSPKEEDDMRTFNQQIEEDKRIVISRSNLNELRKVLEENDLSCSELLHIHTDGVILTKSKAEKVVGWARNHYLSSCLLPSITREKLNIPRESIEVAISRMKERESINRKPSQSLKNLAKDEYETNFVSAVVPPGEIGVKFADIGALEDVKKALNELVILPMNRPELFSRGNLLRPCKGILLFGPPGTGKTLLAKALATEAGANFISITGSTLTSKWFGDAEKLTKALFSFASKLAPVIIFVDEVDSLLGARGGSFEHEATRRMRNEFMAAWDGLRTKDTQRILILGATNRPFDLDDAVIRRLPRRIYVDLPDAENRLKILKIFLSQENLESEFQYEKLANLTEGYSGSDLKNLCIAAAYRPVQELLEAEKKGVKNDQSAALRPLKVDDFVQSKAKVGPSVAYDATSMNELRKWNDQYGEGGSRSKSPFGF